MEKISQWFFSLKGPNSSDPNAMRATQDPQENDRDPPWPTFTSHGLGPRERPRQTVDFDPLSRPTGAISPNLDSRPMTVETLRGKSIKASKVTRRGGSKDRDYNTHRYLANS